MRYGSVIIAVILLAAAVAGCTGALRPAKLTLTPVSYAALPGWSGDSHFEAVPALKRSCGALAGKPDAAPLGPRGMAGRAADWRAPCAALERLPAGDDGAARAFFERWFSPFRAANRGDAEGMFTGYFEPELNGSRRRGGRYNVPLYLRPPDLVSVDLGRFRRDYRGQRIVGRVVDGALVPLPTRGDIDSGAIAGKGLELVWVDDPVDAFFLHIQGSGRVVMDDGSVMRLGYDATNGHRYTAIGGALIRRGAIAREDMSMQAIRAWLDANPGEAKELMASNRSYVFFRQRDGASPFGAQGVPLTAGRSLAIDRRFVAYGLPVWLDTTDPLDPERTLRRLMIAQDTGGAIRGPVRGDFYWGSGADAAARAGRMRQKGQYFLLLPRAITAAPTS